jgi:hypothetical protein
MTFLSTLPSASRSPQIPPEDDLYGRLIGSWDLDVVSIDDEGVTRHTKGEAHLGRVLEGRAVQDVFINPRRVDRGPGMAAFANWFGTTLRIYDPNIRAWRVWWFNPHDGVRAELLGRREGDQIVQEGSFPDGTPIRWVFSEITSHSFLWRAERLQPDKTWRLEVEFRARRAKRPEPAQGADLRTQGRRGPRPAKRVRIAERRTARRR